jgi:hypothetical protein
VVTAEVGLLSRNIIVEGEDYNNLYKESHGGRILVGASSNGIGKCLICIFMWFYSQSNKLCIDFILYPG